MPIRIVLADDHVLVRQGSSLADRFVLTSRGAKNVATQRDYL
jgi:hypothetical protein